MRTGVSHCKRLGCIPSRCRSWPGTEPHARTGAVPLSQTVNFLGDSLLVPPFPTSREPIAPAETGRSAAVHELRGTVVSLEVQRGLVAGGRDLAPGLVRRAERALARSTRTPASRRSSRTSRCRTRCPPSPWTARRQLRGSSLRRRARCTAPLGRSGARRPPPDGGCRGPSPARPRRARSACASPRPSRRSGGSSYFRSVNS